MLALLFAINAGSLACSDDAAETTTTPADGCIDYGAIDVNACGGGPCSLAGDVVPIFRRACSIGSSCHNSVGATAKEDLALAPSLADPDPTQADIDTLHARLVNGSANRSTLPLVVASDPTRSWLLAKMEYANFSVCAAVNDSCKDSTDGCGLLMPEGNAEPLEADVAIVRAWIAAGAPNN